MRKAHSLIIAGLLIIAGALPLPAEAAPTLTDWLNRAMADNPGYRLSLQDYQLQIESHESAERSGLKEVSFAVNPLEISTQSFVYPSLKLSYSGTLPYQIKLDGDNSLLRDENGQVQLSSNLNLNLDIMELLNRAKATKDQVTHREQTQHLRQISYTLFSNVLSEYFTLLDNYFGQQIAEKKLEIVRIKEKQAKVKYDARQISEISYAAAQDEVADAERFCLSLQMVQAKDLLEFAWLFGLKEVDGSLQVLPAEAVTAKDQAVNQLAFITTQILAAINLDTSAVDDFLGKWSTEQIDSTYLPMIYEYTKAEQAVKDAAEALSEAKDTDKWTLELGASADYGTKKNDVDITGRVGFSKQLYSAEGKISREKAALQLEQTKLALAEAKNSLTYKLLSQVAAVQLAEKELTQAQLSEKAARERLERVQKQYALGYVAKEEVLSGQIAVLDKAAALVKAKQASIEAKLALGNTLGLAVFGQ